MLLEKRCNDKVCELKMFLFGTKININTRVKNVSQCFFFLWKTPLKKKNAYCLFYAWERIIKSLSFVKLILSYLLIFFFDQICSSVLSQMIMKTPPSIKLRK